MENANPFYCFLSREYVRSYIMVYLALKEGEYEREIVTMQMV